MDKLLKCQNKVIRGDNSLQEKLEKSKKKLVEKLKFEEINELCKIQTELTKLQIKLESLETEYQSQILQPNLPPNK